MRPDFVTGGTAVELRPAISALPQGCKKNFPLQISPVDELFAQPEHLSRNEVIDPYSGRVRVSLRDLRVMRRQASEKGANMIGAPMRQCQIRHLIIQLETMADAAILFVGDGLEIGPAGSRLMAEGAVDAPSVDEGNVVRFKKMASVIELERVGFAELVCNEPKLRMILGKALQDRGETVRRSRRLEGFPTRIAAIIEQGRRQRFSLLGRRRHLAAVAMTF